MTFKLSKHYVIPESSFALACLAAGHLVVALWELGRWKQFGDSALFCIPVALMAGGGIIDNWRLFRGSVLGEEGIDTYLTSLSYFFRMSARPVLWVTIGELLGHMTGFTLLAILCRMACVTMCVQGFNELMIGVIGNYEVSDDGQVWRYTLDPDKKTLQILVPPMVVGAGGFLASLLSWYWYSNSLSMYIQFFTVVGQAVAYKDPEIGLHVNNLLELVFLADLSYMQFLAMAV